MTNMTNDEIAEMIAERNGNLHYCKNCDDCCQPYDSTDDCFKSAMQAMELKDKQYNEERKELLGLVKMLKMDEQNQTIIEDLIAILN